MIQNGLIASAHTDIVTDAQYDFYGLHLATCGVDQRCVRDFARAQLASEVSWAVGFDARPGSPCCMLLQWF